jgi:hypothetical protein
MWALVAWAVALAAFSAVFGARLLGWLAALP